MYTVGPEYAHAEARKSPALDGKVDRDGHGKEVRFPVILSGQEKLVAQRVTKAFKVYESLQRSVFWYSFDSRKYTQKHFTAGFVCQLIPGLIVVMISFSFVSFYTDLKVSPITRSAYVQLM